MRTDSVNLSETALTAARRQIAELYGQANVPPQPRRYTGKVKNAQEAHEAIRPAGDNFRTPGEVAKELSADEFRLYELIWRRTIASQMTDAVGNSVSVRIRAISTAGRGGRLRRLRQDDHRPGLPAGVRGVVGRRERRGRGRRAPPAEPGQGPAADRRGAGRGRPPHLAAGPLHRGVAGQGAGGAGHRPPLDVRVDHADDPGPRLRGEARPGADPVVPGVRGGRPARGALPAGWSTTTSPPRWRPSSTTSPAATTRRWTSSPRSTSAARQRARATRSPRPAA